VLYAARRTAGSWSDVERQTLLDVARQAALVLEVAGSAREMAEVAAYTERQRWAVEMHDTVGAVLFSIRAALTKLRDEPLLVEALARDVAKIEQLAEQASTGVRTQLRSMHSLPPDKALAVALRTDCRELSARTGIRADVVILGDLPVLESSRSDALLRASRETLLNVEKHAHANSVVLSLFRSDDGVGMALADDGVGIDQSPRRESVGLGLAAAAERLERVGGWLSFSDNDEGGGTVRAWVPAIRAGRPAEH
jgi:signal transduction histidine kinase